MTDVAIGDTDRGEERLDPASEHGGVVPETKAVADTFDFTDVAVVMGAYNEEAAVGSVLDDIARVTNGAADVTIVDSSTDRTPEIARKKGASVISQPPRGYGEAVREAILAPDRPVIVTTDCDATYPMEAIPRLLGWINCGYDVVSGDRLYQGADAMPRVNKWGNAGFALLSSLLVGRRLHDVTTGMRAYRREVVRDIEWTENTGLSAELLLRPVSRGYQVREEPIEYRERAGETTLDPLAGGAAIAKSILKVGIEERIR